MEPVRLLQMAQQALPQEQSLDHRTVAQMDGIGIPGAAGKIPDFFRSKNPPGSISSQGPSVQFQ